MKITNENLCLENAIEKEWIITNGIGGYASSTVIGANTRKYHGLLVAPIAAPAKRYLVLSKVDESIEINGKKYELFTNIGKNFISKGYEYQTEFEKDYLPNFEYQIEDIKIKKTICLEYGKNTVVINYKIINGKNTSKFNVTPIINFRDFHSIYNNYITIKQEKIRNKIKVILNNREKHPVFFRATEGEYIEFNNTQFNGMFYIEEEKRGFDAVENHAIPGMYSIEIKPNDEKDISFICSLEENIEELDANEIIEREKVRLRRIIIGTDLIDNKKNNKTQEEIQKDEIIKAFIISTDNFVTYRPMFREYTLIAGFPWFLDWMRDSLISFEGLLLKTKRFDIAKSVLRTSIRDIKYGLIPNGYSEFDNTPLYNSVDSSLLLFEQVQKYLEYTEDYLFVENEIYPKLQIIIENYQRGIKYDDNNVYQDNDGLIYTGSENTQNTWMDAKYNGIAITPRNGKVVEINALWYNALMIISSLTNKFGKRSDSKKYKEFAENVKKSFNNEFYNKRRKCLYDVIGDGKIRPNQLFSLSLTYPVIEPSSRQAKELFMTVEKKLFNNYGLKTLAKNEPDYIEIYEGGPEQRDKSYHQGITWPWLMGLYYNSLKNMMKDEKNRIEKNKLKNQIKELRKNVKETFSKELVQRGCIGSIAEIYDSVKPFSPKGAFAQAWSVAEIFRIIVDED